MTSFQRLIREEEAKKNPRSSIQSLTGCRVVTITKKQMMVVIGKYEWLAQPRFGSSFGRSQASYGLLSQSEEVIGAVSFGLSGGSRSANLCDIPAKTICLERGACVHYAPKNAASFLIRYACSLAYKEHGWEVFYAYADQEAGEFGYVYQASNWHFIGEGPKYNKPTPDGIQYGTMLSFYETKDGKRITDRVKRKAFHKKKSEILFPWTPEDAGYTRIQLPVKRKYVWFEGPRSKLLRAHCRFPFLPYPKSKKENAPLTEPESRVSLVLHESRLTPAHNT